MEELYQRFISGEFKKAICVDGKFEIIERALEGEVLSFPTLDKTLEFNLCNALIAANMRDLTFVATKDSIKLFLMRQGILLVEATATEFKVLKNTGEVEIGQDNIILPGILDHAVRTHRFHFELAEVVGDLDRILTDTTITEQKRFNSLAKLAGKLKYESDLVGFYATYIEKVIATLPAPNLTNVGTAITLTDLLRKAWRDGRIDKWELAYYLRFYTPTMQPLPFVFSILTNLLKLIPFDHVVADKSLLNIQAYVVNNIIMDLPISSKDCTLFVTCKDSARDALTQVAEIVNSVCKVDSSASLVTSKYVESKFGKFCIDLIRGEENPIDEDMATLKLDTWEDFSRELFGINSALNYYKDNRKVLSFST